MPSKLCVFVLGFLVVFTAFGCEPVLETGYKPHPLNATDSARRAYYAPAFTPDALGEKKDDTGPGFGLQP